MDDRSNRIAHFASLFVFLAVWGWLIYAGTFREGFDWRAAAFFIMGASFAVGVLTKNRPRNSIQTT
jgi:hypothetical protein